MLLGFEKWIGSWSDKTYKIVRNVIICILVLSIVKFTFASVVFYGFTLRYLIKARSYKQLHEKNNKEAMNRFRMEWNTFFKDNSFDTYFNEEDIESTSFYQTYTKRFNAKKQEREYNQSKQNHTKDENNVDSNLLYAVHYFGYKNINEINAFELRQRYKKLMRQHHPDNGGSLKESQKVNEYYEELKKRISA